MKLEALIILEAVFFRFKCLIVICFNFVLKIGLCLLSNLYIHDIRHKQGDPIPPMGLNTFDTAVISSLL